MKFDLSTIRQFWVLLLALLAGVTWIPEWVLGLGTPEGTEAIFAVVEAVLVLFQFLPFRKEKSEDPNVAELNAQGSTTAKVLYLLPFMPAPGRLKGAA